MGAMRFNERNIEVVGPFDSVVVGGGTAGSIAAIQAARLGCSVLVVEANAQLGGTATSALVSPMMASWVSHAPLFEELIGRLSELGGRVRADAGEVVWFNPDDMAWCLERLLIEAGGQIMYAAQVVDVSLDETDSIERIIVFSCGSFIAIRASNFIDATGDAVLSRLCGVPTVHGDESGVNQSASLRFEMAGVDVEEYRAFCAEIGDAFCALKPGDHFESAMVYGKGFALEPLFRRGVELGLLTEDDLGYYQCFTIPGKPGCMTFNCPRIPRFLDATSPEQRSRALSVGREMIRRMVRFLVALMPGFEHAFLLKQANMLGIRESWRIVGEYTLCEQDYVNRARFADAIARGDWYIDVHAADGNDRERDAYEKGEYYEIPWRSLINAHVGNLATVGRCISATFLMQSSVRIQPTLIDMGYAAGCALAIARRDAGQLHDIDATGILPR